MKQNKHFNADRHSPSDYSFKLSMTVMVVIIRVKWTSEGITYNQERRPQRNLIYTRKHVQKITRSLSHSLANLDIIHQLQNYCGLPHRALCIACVVSSIFHCTGGLEMLKAITLLVTHLA